MKLIASGRHAVGGHEQVALVLAVLVVHDDDHPPGAESSMISSVELSGMGVQRMHGSEKQPANVT
jgi:hypothetical protein